MAGYSLDEIANATMEVQSIKSSRLESMRAPSYRPSWQKFTVVMENTSRALKVMTLGKPRTTCAKSA